MPAMYRVRAHPFEKDDFVYEVFEAKSDADRFWEELVTESKVFDRIPYDTAVASYEELNHGTWVLVTTKTVMKNE